MARDLNRNRWALVAKEAEDPNTRSRADFAENYLAAAVRTQSVAVKSLQVGFGSQSVVAGCTATRNLSAEKSIAIVADCSKLAVEVAGYSVDCYYFE